MKPAAFHLSNAFHRLLFADERGVEPLLIADRTPSDSPQRIFLVRYIVGEGGGGESKRPIFRDELTGYDYVSKELYHTQKVKLDDLQASVEPFMYASSEAQLSRVVAENVTSGEQRPIKAIISESLVEKLITLYGFGW